MAGTVFGPSAGYGSGHSNLIAGMVKLVYTKDLKSFASWLAGSIPATRTNKRNIKMDEIMISFAASTGEGTLINYGTITLDEFYDIMQALYLENVTIIVGPADGTGE